jgi:hypothetical protein
MDINLLNENLDKLQKSYELDVKNFKKFSPLGSIQYSNLETSFNINLNPNLDTDTDINTSPEFKENYKSTKKLLKIIHPDKINLFFSHHDNQIDLNKLIECSNTIIQENYDFIDSMNLIATKTVFFDYICDKLNISQDSREKIIKINFDESIDKHFDPQIINFIEKYNYLKSNTIYNFIKSKISILMTNLNSDLNQLLKLISNRLVLAKTSSYFSSNENDQMSANDYPLETSIVNKTIEINELAALYPNSKFNFTLSFVKSVITDVSFQGTILISEYMYLNISLDYSKIKTISKQIYNQFKNSLVK